MSLILIVSVCFDFSVNSNNFFKNISYNISLKSNENENVNHEDKKVSSLNNKIEGTYPLTDFDNEVSVREKISNSLAPQKVYEICSIKINDLTSELKKVLKNIWIIGIFIFLGYHVCIYLYFLRDLRKHNVGLYDNFCCDILKELSKKYNLKSIPKAYINEFAPMPMVVNIFKPSIIIPKHLIFDKNIEIILSHEIIHIKRRDLIFKYIILIANAIHWFNPFIYLLKELFNENCELVCDEILLNDKSLESKKIYGNIILDTVNKSKEFSKLTYVGFVSNKKILKKRVQAILNNNKLKNSRILYISSCTVVCMIFLFTVSCTLKNDYSTIQKSVNSISNIGPRIYGSQSNARISKEIKDYLSKSLSDKWKIETQKYNIKNPHKYELSIKSYDSEFILDNKNCIFLDIGADLNNLNSCRIVNDVEKIEGNKNYIFMSESKDEITKAFGLGNVKATIYVLNSNTFKLSKQAGNTVYSDNNKTYGAVNKDTAKLLEKFFDKDIKVSLKIDFNDLELENIIATMKGKDGSEAVLVTAHYDSVTALGEKKYSKGLLDNGSGVVLLLDMIRKFENLDFAPEHDIVFSFVNSEEQAMLLGYGGSKYLNTFMLGKYVDFTNLNLDCLGQKGIDELRYGIKGDLNEKYFEDLLIRSNGDKYKLIRDDTYGSDHINFKNAIFIYNFDRKDVIFHKEVDNKSSIDIKSLERISDICYETVKSLSYAKNEELLTKDSMMINENTVVSKCDSKFNSFINTLEFGEYVFFKCEEPDICKDIDYHYLINARYKLTSGDIATLKDIKGLELPFYENISEYVEFNLPNQEYVDTIELDTVYSFFSEKLNLQDIKNMYDINSISYTYFENNDLEKTYDCRMYNLNIDTLNYQFMLKQIDNSNDYEEIQGDGYVLYRGTSKDTNKYMTICIKSLDGIKYMLVVSSDFDTVYDDDVYLASLISKFYEKLIK